MMDGIFICLAFTAFMIGLIFIREVLLWLRNKIPKTVQCWFCHSKTVVQYKLSNNWYCPSCDQYNGFSKNGDYNKMLDNHYEEKLNFTITSIGRTKDAWKSANRLCEKCNHNQELKVQQLASFVPLNERNYDVEVDHYRKQLEKSYKLCSNCEEVLSRIFTNERNLFSIPRRLVSSLIIKPEITGIARFILYMNLLVSLIISISAYTKLEGIPPVVLPYLKEYSNFHITLQAFKPAYLLCLGLVFNILGWIYIKSSGLLLNSLSWFIVLILTTFTHGYKHYIIALQALSGIISCGVSVISLTSKRRSKEKSTNVFDGRKFNSSHSFATANSSFDSVYNVGTSSVENISQFNQKSYKFNNSSTKSPPTLSPGKTPTLNSNIIKPQKNWSEAINTGVRGLNIGNNISKNISRSFTQRRFDNSNSSDAWWLNGSTKNNRRNQAQKNTFQTNIRPPSTSSSGFSEIVEDLVDDCTSCTGNSPICRHTCQFSPSQVEYTCYYAAAYFQRLLYSTPPNQSTPKVSLNIEKQRLATNDPFSFIYSLPIITLIMSNIALLWTVYNQEIIKE